MNEDRIAELKRKLQSADSEIVRIIEDLIDVLVSKKVLKMTDFPEITRVHLQHRKEMRSEMADLIGRKDV